MNISAGKINWGRASRGGGEKSNRMFSSSPGLLQGVEREEAEGVKQNYN